MSDSFFDMPAGYRDADIEMAALEDAGNRGHAAQVRSAKLRDAGKLALAADACPHWSTYGLGGTCARDAGDPRYGQHGERCQDCGSWIQDMRRWDGQSDPVLAACEIPPTH